MRSQWCREHIDETAEHCGIDESTVSEVKQAAQFCVEHPEYSDCSTMAILVLIRYPDMAVRDNATLSIKKSFDSGKHPLTGKIIKAKILTAKEVKKILEKEEIALRGEVVKVIKEAKKAEPAPVVKPEPAKPSPAGQTLTEKMAAQPQQPVFYKPDPAPAPVPAAPPRPPASMTPDKERIVKECLTAILTPKVMGMVDAMVAGGQWEKTYLDFLVIVIKDGITRKL